MVAGFTVAGFMAVDFMAAATGAGIANLSLRLSVTGSYPGEAGNTGLTKIIPSQRENKDVSGTGTRS
jgi:hypothetical protein